MIKKLFSIFLILTFLSSNLVGTKGTTSDRIKKLTKEFKDLQEKVNSSAHMAENAQHNFTYNFMNSLQSGAAHALADIAVRTAFDWGSYEVKKIYHKIRGIEDLEDISRKQGAIKTDQALQNNQAALINNDITMLAQINALMSGCSSERQAVIQKKYDQACELTLDNYIKFKKSVKPISWPADRLRQDPKIFNVPNPAISRLNLTDISELDGHQPHNDEYYADEEDDEEYANDDEY
jgi:hypothetical protein